jgi:hypothetical protein
MQIKKETSVHINETLTALATAEGVLQTAETALTDEQGQCRTAVAEKERLEAALRPDDKAGIQQLLILRIKISLYSTPLKELGDAVVRARAALDGRKGQVCDALAEAGKEIDVERTKIARAALSSVTDTAEWIEKALPGLSSVWFPRRFIELCGQRAVERDLQLSLAKISEVLLRGELPPVPRPDPNELATVLRSMTADASLRY